MTKFRKITNLSPLRRRLFHQVPSSPTWHPQKLLNTPMNQTAHNRLVSFIWTIADDCLRDVYVRGKYRDVILPMVVLRRLDTLLEPTKAEILKEVSFQQNEMKAIELDDAPLKAASGYVFFNTSKWTLKQLHATATNNQQILLTNISGRPQHPAQEPQVIEAFKKTLPTRWPRT